MQILSEIDPLSDQCSIALVAEAEAPRQQRYIVETITMTTVTERRIVREASPQGILKGGATGKREDAEDGKRSVRFSEGTILPPDSPLPLAEPPQLPEVAKTEAETEATMEAAPKPTAAKQLFGPDSTDGGVALRQFEEAKRAKLSQYYSELQQVYLTYFLHEKALIQFPNKLKKNSGGGLENSYHKYYKQIQNILFLCPIV